MFWLVRNLFSWIVYFSQTVSEVCRVVVWAVPFLWNLLLLLSAVQAAVFVLLQFHRICVNLAKSRTNRTRRTNSVTFPASERLKSGPTKKNWDQNQLVGELEVKFNQKYKKSKSFEHLRHTDQPANVISCEDNTSDSIIKSAIAEWKKKAETRNFEKSSRNSEFSDNNKYFKKSHKTTFISKNVEDDDNSDEIELLSSEEESLYNESLSFKDLSEDEDLKQNEDNKNGNSFIITDELDPSKNEHEFVKFAESTNFLHVLELFKTIRDNLGLEVHAGTFKNVFYILKEELRPKIPYRYGELFDHLEEKGRSKEYCNNTVAQGKKVLVIGAGPCGLRMAMELQYLGAETTLLESRPYMDRNNVLKLWTFVMEDLKSLGAKKLCPQIGTGSVNHISIRILQFILLKMALLLGTQIRVGDTFKKIKEPTNDRMWVVVSEEKNEDGTFIEHEEEFDMVICASGRKVDVPGFERASLDAKMAIAITANFVNNNTPLERKVAEIPGLSKQYDLEFFKNLENSKGIRLENIVYYKNLTHYFVMTAKKDSLIKKGVIKEDTDDRDKLLRPENVDRQALEQYAREAAAFSTKYFSQELPPSPFASWKNQKDVTIFDFTNLYSSHNACRVREVLGHKLLLGLVGDSLIQPFWPEGTGIGRGFLSVLDTAWLVKQYCEERSDVYEVIREREKLYSLLRQTTDSSLKTNFKKWTINPTTRYQTTSFPFPNQERIFQLFDTDRQVMRKDSGLAEEEDIVLRKDSRRVEEEDVVLRKRKLKTSKSLGAGEGGRWGQTTNRETIFVAE